MSFRLGYWCWLAAVPLKAPPELRVVERLPNAELGIVIVFEYGSSSTGITVTSSFSL